MMEKYTKVRSIGKGNMGTCTLARNNEDGRCYVIKQVDLTRLSRKDRQQSLNEARVLSSLRHPNIINYVDSFLARKSDSLCIVMEFADGGDLSTRLKKSYGVNLPEWQVLDWLIQLVMSLDYIHDRKILHRDVKTANIFLTGDNVVKLGDFGIARTLTSTYDQAQTFVGTPYYLSPELILEKPYDHRSDVWALGVVLYELMTLRHPFNAKDMKGLLQCILTVRYDPLPNSYSAEVRDIVRRMLVRSPADRISLKEVLQLPVVEQRILQWFSDLDAVPRHYRRSLVKHHLVPASMGEMSTDIPPPQLYTVAAAAAAAAAAVVVEPSRLSDSTTSETIDAPQNRTEPYEVPPPPPMRDLPRRSRARLSTLLPAAPSMVHSPPSASPPVLYPLSSQIYTRVTPQPTRASKPMLPPLSSSPVPVAPLGSLAGIRSAARQRRPHVRPYVTQSHLPTPAVANIPRSSPAEPRRYAGGRVPPAFLNPLYRPPHLAPAPLAPLYASPAPPADIKAMLHRATADRARRRQELHLASS